MNSEIKLVNQHLKNLLKRNIFADHKSNLSQLYIMTLRLENDYNYLTDKKLLDRIEEIKMFRSNFQTKEMMEDIDYKIVWSILQSLKMSYTLSLFKKNKFCLK